MSYLNITDIKFDPQIASIDEIQQRSIFGGAPSSKNGNLNREEQSVVGLFVSASAKYAAEGKDRRAPLQRGVELYKDSNPDIRDTLQGVLDGLPK